MVGEGACPVHHGTLGSIPGLHPLEASNTPELCQPNTSADTARGPLGSSGPENSSGWARALFLSLNPQGCGLWAGAGVEMQAETLRLVLSEFVNPPRPCCPWD